MSGAIDEKFSKIPFDEIPKRARQLGFQIPEHGTSVRSVDVGFFKQGESHVEFLDEGLNFFRCARFLFPELIAREREDLQARVSIFLVQFDQLGIVQFG